MKYYELDKNEEQTLKDYGRGKFKSLRAAKAASAQYRLWAQKALDKNRNVNIRIAESDLLKIKSLAVEKGIPYQTLLTSLIHQYSKGEIKHKVV